MRHGCSTLLCFLPRRAAARDGKSVSRALARCGAVSTPSPPGCLHAAPAETVICIPGDRSLAASARARPAHRRRRVRLRRHDGPPRRGRLRGPVRGVLDRDPLAAARLPARHAGARGARGDGRARDPGVAPDGARLRRAHASRTAARTSSSCSSRSGRSGSRTSSSSRPTTTSTRTTRRSRRKGCGRSSGRRSSATRSPGTTSTSPTAPTSRSSSATWSARSRRSRSTPRSSTAATRTPSTSGTSRRCTGRT